MVVQGLFEALSGRVGLNCCWMAVTQMGEKRYKSVEVCSKPEFWWFNFGSGSFEVMRTSLKIWKGSGD